MRIQREGGGVRGSGLLRRKDRRGKISLEDHCYALIIPPGKNNARSYCSIAPQMEHSFLFLIFYMKVSSP